ncbi:MAG: thiamine pyrophosphate-requiring protein, partial [Alicyclobacillus sp.]|nr:thiamine pyrophosphate-requiring protein [Alicyclobacillus sp.]
ANTRRLAADLCTEALLQAGVEYLFVNLGTDHPGFIESWAQREAAGQPLPQIIISPHETVGLAAALGYAQVSGRMQAVLVHVDVGTQNLGGMIHNAARGRVPVLVLAGASSVTLEGELPASRTDYIQYIQDVFDQQGIVRGYVKWSYEAKTGQNLPTLVYRAAQVAQSAPQGPVYLVVAREHLEESIPADRVQFRKWPVVGGSALPPEAVETLLDTLLQAQRPVILTTYFGRRPQAVATLVQLSERLAVPVVEVNRSVVNFPTHHPHHLGFEAARWVRQADVVVVLDCDVPWLPTTVQPAPHAKVWCLDVDPVKDSIPLWHIPADAAYRVDSAVALQQLLTTLNARPALTGEAADRLEQRRRWVAEQRAAMLAAWAADPALHPEKEVITPEFLTSCVSEVIGEDSIVMNETCSRNLLATQKYLQRTRPGTLFTSGGSSLGWGGGAALGAKLARPHQTVVHLTGDGAFVFGCPTAVYWMARRYQAPFLTVIYDNGGWDAPKKATLRVHPQGVSAQTDRFWTRFDLPPDYPGVAEAAGGDLGPAPAGQLAQDGNGHLPAEDRPDHPPGDAGELGQADQGGGDENFVRKGVEGLAELGRLLPHPGRPAVEAVGQGGQHEETRGDQVLVGDVPEEEEDADGGEDDTERRQAVGQIHRASPPSGRIRRIMLRRLARNSCPALPRPRARPRDRRRRP